MMTYGLDDFAHIKQNMIEKELGFITIKTIIRIRKIRRSRTIRRIKTIRPIIRNITRTIRKLEEIEQFYSTSVEELPLNFSEII